MSPNNIVRDSRTLIQNKLLQAVPKKWLPQFRFGLQAYSLQTFQSATGNARRVIRNPIRPLVKVSGYLPMRG